MIDGHQHSEDPQINDSLCSETDVDLYLDGELPASREADLFRHLSICSWCRDCLNSVLSLRRINGEEYIVVPPWADDALLVRVDKRRREGRRTAQLHTNQSFWSTRTTVTIRSVIVVAGVVLVSAAYLTNQLASSSAYVTVEQEHVRFIDPMPPLRSEVYVFYPGLTIEADR
jgi:anti-sigma factor RsiW